MSNRQYGWILGPILVLIVLVYVLGLLLLHFTVETSSATTTSVKIACLTEQTNPAVHALCVKDGYSK